MKNLPTFSEFITESLLLENRRLISDVRSLADSKEVIDIIPNALQILNVILKIKTIKDLETHKEFLTDEWTKISKSKKLKFNHETAINPNYAQIFCINLWRLTYVKKLEDGLNLHGSKYTQNIIPIRLIEVVNHAKALDHEYVSSWKGYSSQKK